LVRACDTRGTAHRTASHRIASIGSRSNGGALVRACDLYRCVVIVVWRIPLIARGLLSLWLLCVSTPLTSSLLCCAMLGTAGPSSSKRPVLAGARPASSPTSRATQRSSARLVGTPAAWRATRRAAATRAASAPPRAPSGATCPQRSASAALAATADGLFRTRGRCGCSPCGSDGEDFEFIRLDRKIAEAGRRPKRRASDGVGEARAAAGSSLGVSKSVKST